MLFTLRVVINRVSAKLTHSLSNGDSVRSRQCLHPRQDKEGEEGQVQGGRALSSQTHRSASLELVSLSVLHSS